MIRDTWLRRGLGLASPILLASCGTSPPPAPPSPAPPPFYVQGGAGSEHGNFQSYEDVETTGPGGLRCVVHVWDRPLTADTALRLRSQSCQDPRNPDMFIATELERMVIPMASSTLITGQ